jgi:hypothetical protein
LEILLGPALEVSDPASHVQKDRRGYIFGDILAEESMNAKSIYPLVVKLVEPPQRISFGMGPEHQTVIVCLLNNFRHNTNHRRKYNCAAGKYVT